MAKLLALAFALFAGVASAQLYSPVGTYGTPTMGACGTSPSVVGTNASGTITVGSGTVTSCVLNFSAAQPGTPACTISTSATVITRISAVSATALTVAFASSSPSVVVYYACNVK